MQELLSAGPAGIAAAVQKLLETQALEPQQASATGTEQLSCSHASQALLITGTSAGSISWILDTGLGVAQAACVASCLAAAEPEPASQPVVLDLSWPARQLQLASWCSYTQHPVPPAKHDKRGLLVQLPAVLGAAAGARQQGRRLILCDSTGEGLSCCKLVASADH